VIWRETPPCHYWVNVYAYIEIVIW